MIVSRSTPVARPTFGPTDHRGILLFSARASPTLLYSSKCFEASLRCSLVGLTDQELLAIVRCGSPEPLDDPTLSEDLRTQHGVINVAWLLGGSFEHPQQRDFRDRSSESQCYQCDEWCCQTGLNCRPLHYQWSALPLSYGSVPRIPDSAKTAATRRPILATRPPRAQAWDRPAVSSKAAAIRRKRPRPPSAG